MFSINKVVSLNIQKESLDEHGKTFLIIINYAVFNKH